MERGAKASANVCEVLAPSSHLPGEKETGFESGGRWPWRVNTDGGGAGYLGRHRKANWSPGMPRPWGTWEGLLGD